MMSGDVMDDVPTSGPYTVWLKRKDEGRSKSSKRGGGSGPGFFSCCSSGAFDDEIASDPALALRMGFEQSSYHTLADAVTAILSEAPPEGWNAVGQPDSYICIERAGDAKMRSERIELLADVLYAFSSQMYFRNKSSSSSSSDATRCEAAAGSSEAKQQQLHPSTSTTPPPMTPTVEARHHGGHVTKITGCGIRELEACVVGFNGGTDSGSVKKFVPSIVGACRGDDLSDWKFVREGCRTAKYGTMTPLYAARRAAIACIGIAGCVIKSNGKCDMRGPAVVICMDSSRDDDEVATAAAAATAATSVSMTTVPLVAVGRMEWCHRVAGSFPENADVDMLCKFVARVAPLIAPAPRDGFTASMRAPFEKTPETRACPGVLADYGIASACMHIGCFSGGGALATSITGISQCKCRRFIVAKDRCTYARSRISEVCTMAAETVDQHFPTTMGDLIVRLDAAIGSEHRSSCSSLKWPQKTESCGKPGCPIVVEGVATYAPSGTYNVGVFTLRAALLGKACGTAESPGAIAKACDCARFMPRPGGAFGLPGVEDALGLAIALEMSVKTLYEVAMLNPFSVSARHADRVASSAANLCNIMNGTIAGLNTTHCSEFPAGPIAFAMAVISSGSRQGSVMVGSPASGVAYKLIVTALDYTDRARINLDSGALDAITAAGAKHYSVYRDRERQTIAERRPRLAGDRTPDTTPNFVLVSRDPIDQGLAAKFINGAIALISRSAGDAAREDGSSSSICDKPTSVALSPSSENL